MSNEIQIEILQCNNNKINSIWDEGPSSFMLNSLPSQSVNVDVYRIEYLNIVNYLLLRILYV